MMFVLSDSGQRRRSNPSRSGGRRSFRPAPLPLEVRSLLSLTIQINYDYDTGHFFDTQARKDLMQGVANAIGASVNAPLAAITPSGSDTWQASFLDPTTGATRVIQGPAVPPDTIIIFVGSRPLSGPEEGIGGPGGYQYVSSDQAWINLLRSRGEAGALSPQQTQTGLWGGSIAFDDSHTNWYFGTDPSGMAPDQVDFVTVAAHEIGHVLGIGDTTPGAPWERYVTASGFVGPASDAAYGGVVPLQTPLGAHWGDGTLSNGSQDLMDPSLPWGSREVFSSLDYAGLQDLGYSVHPPSRFQFSAASYQAVPGAGSIAVTVDRVGPTDRAATVHYTTEDGGGPSTALIDPSGSGDSAGRAGIDYRPTSGVLHFAPGEGSRTITVPILNPAQAATGRAFRVVLSVPGDLEAVGSNGVTTVSLPSGSPGGPGGSEVAPGVLRPVTPLLRAHRRHHVAYHHPHHLGRLPTRWARPRPMVRGPRFAHHPR